MCTHNHRIREYMWIQNHKIHHVYSQSHNQNTPCVLTITEYIMCTHNHRIHDVYSQSQNTSCVLTITMITETMSRAFSLSGPHVYLQLQNRRCVLTITQLQNTSCVSVLYCYCTHNHTIIEYIMCTYNHNT